MKKLLPSFTLLEVLISITIMTLGTGLLTAWSLASIKGTELQTTAEILISTLRNLKIAAQENVGNTDHGLLLEEHMYTRFEGNSFDNSPLESRFQISVPAPLEISNINLNGGGSEIIFKSGDGSTDQFGTFQIERLNVNKAYTVSISPLGLIDWQ